MKTIFMNSLMNMRTRRTYADGMSVSPCTDIVTMTAGRGDYDTQILYKDIGMKRLL